MNAIVNHNLYVDRARVAAHCPSLFSSLVFVDPVIIQYAERTGRYVRMDNFVQGALGRRDGWSSKDEALHLFSANPFFATWDPAVLQAYIEHGLTPDSAPSPGQEGGVKLKTPGIQEALVFASETRLSNETWELLAHIDERVTMRWMMPGDQNALSKP